MFKNVHESHARPAPALEFVHALADGAVLRGIVLKNEAIFPVLAGTRELILMSPRFKPGGGDQRTLGVVVDALRLEAGSTKRRIALDDPAFGRGFHEVETGDGRPWRWTDGAGHLAPSLWDGFAGAFLLRIGGLFDRSRGTTAEDCRIAA